VAGRLVIRYVLDDSARRLDEGRALLAGSPLALFRLSEEGARVLGHLVAGSPLPPNAAKLTERLLDAGAIHPRPDGGPYSLDDVTVVIPAHNVDVCDLVASLGPVRQTIVVDDGSEHPIVASGATVIRRPVNGGPAAARNTGLAAVTTPIVAFIDTDCRPDPGWLETLLRHFADDRVAAVAPRVSSPVAAGVTASVLDRYEAVRSPLDLGDREGRVRAGTRISYVPGAALVARADLVLASGGFDEDLRAGEDVDLVWRLDESGARVRYEPAAVVRHQPRRTLWAWMAQRASYGRSATGLAVRHPGAVPPVAVSGWSAAVWALAAVGAPGAGLGVAGATALALAGKLDGLDRPIAEAARLTGVGHLFAGRLLASAVTRAWWPVLLPLALISKRVRRVLFAAALIPPLVDWVRQRPALDPVRYLALRMLDDAAYSVGVWRGVVVRRTLEPVLPDLTSWPRPSRYDRRTTPS
jgi:mycofactocin system glycosyltransferase